MNLSIETLFLWILFSLVLLLVTLFFWLSLNVFKIFLISSLFPFLDLFSSWLILSLLFIMFISFWLALIKFFCDSGGFLSLIFFKFLRLLWIFINLDALCSLILLISFDDWGGFVGEEFKLWFCYLWYLHRNIFISSFFNSLIPFFNFFKTLSFIFICNR